MASSAAYGGYEGEGSSNPGSTKRPRPPSTVLCDTAVLDCPICYEPLKVPILQCQNGHLACSECCDKIGKICTQCKLPVGSFRCRAMEKVVESTRVSCRNARFGCTVETLYSNQVWHDRVCPFTPCSCPLLNCDFTGYYVELNKHIRDIHKVEIRRFMFYTDLHISFEPSPNIVMLQEKDSREVLFIQTFPIDMGMSVSVSHIAPLGPYGRQLSCTLNSYNGSSILEQRLMVKNIDKVMRDQKPEDGYFLIPTYMCGGPGGYLHLVFKIGHGRSIGNWPS